MPTNEFSIKPLKVKLLAGEQKASELFYIPPFFSAYTSTAGAEEWAMGYGVSVSSLVSLVLSSIHLRETIGTGWSISGSFHWSHSQQVSKGRSQPWLRPPS